MPEIGEALRAEYQRAKQAERTAANFEDWRSDAVTQTAVNPFAVAIARFRLLLAAMRTCGVMELATSPAFHVHLACGDSLYHGRQRQQMLGDDWTDEAHYFASEDAPTLRQMLRDGTYHCVVANPPYITPKDRAANEAYRKLYPKTCHRQYSLAVPFMERLFRLAVKGDLTQRREGAKIGNDENLRAFAPLREISLYSVARLADVAARDPLFMEVGEVYRDNPAYDVQRLVGELVAAESVPLLPVLRYKPSGLRKRAQWERTWELQREEDRSMSVVSGQSSVAEDHGQRTTDNGPRTTDHGQRTTDNGPLTIPVPPKYTSADFLSSGGARYWALRGKLDVPKERWISFPHCEGPNGTLVIGWAGYDHLQLARAISAYYVEIQEHLGGRDDPRLVPLLACVIELLPWLRQWHSDIDPDFDQRMDEFFAGFVAEEAKALGLTIDQIKAWQPPQRAGGRGKRRAEA